MRVVPDWICHFLHAAVPCDPALVLDWTENGFVAIRGSQLWGLYNFSHQGCTHGGEKKKDCFLF